MIIYKTINKINGKIYIGKDKKNNSKYFGSGVLLQKAIKKYGKENFVKIILEECSNEEDLNIKEKFWIDYYQSNNNKIGYNITDGGTGGDTFNKNPNKEIIRIKLRQTSTGKKHSEETKKLVSKLRSGSGNGMYGKNPWNKGLKMSDDFKKKLSDKLKGRGKGIPRPDYVKKSISKAHKGKIKSEEHKKKISNSVIRTAAIKHEALLLLTHKVCIKCNIEKSIDDFYKDKRTGLARSYCKKCNNISKK